MKKYTFLIAIIICFMTITYAQNFTATYTFDSVNTSSGITDPTIVPTANGVIFGSFNAIGTPANPNSTARFSFTNWATGASNGNNNYSSLTGSLDTAEYYTVTISPAVGYTITLNDIAFRLQRSGTGIRTTCVKSSIDNFSTNLSASINPANTKLAVQSNNIIFWNYDSITTGQDGSLITLGGSNFANLTAPVTFRFYGWNAEATTGTFSIDNVIINGAAILSTGIKKEVKDNFIVYPNPIKDGQLKIKNLNQENTTLKIYDSFGKIIYSNQLIDETANIDLSGFSNGLYIIWLSTSNYYYSEKIIIN